LAKVRRESWSVIGGASRIRKGAFSEGAAMDDRTWGSGRSTAMPPHPLPPKLQLLVRCERTKPDGVGGSCALLLVFSALSEPGSFL
jgi:hypothetical protein